MGVRGEAAAQLLDAPSAFLSWVLKLSPGWIPPTQCVLYQEGDTGVPPEGYEGCLVG